MTRTSKCGLAGLLVGACLAFWLAVLSTLSWQNFYESHRFFYILAPPTLYLQIFVQLFSPRLKILILLVVIAQNALLYGLFGLIIGKIWSMIQPEPQPE